MYFLRETLAFTLRTTVIGVKPPVHRGCPSLTWSCLGDVPAARRYELSKTSVQAIQIAISATIQLLNISFGTSPASFWPLSGARLNTSKMPQKLGPLR